MQLLGLAHSHLKNGHSRTREVYSFHTPTHIILGHDNVYRHTGSVTSCMFMYVCEFVLHERAFTGRYSEAMRLKKGTETWMGFEAATTVNVKDRYLLGQDDV
jgi:hypothetical protein